MMKKIVLTGGGTAGHVTPNLAIMPHLIEDGWDIHYIGTKEGMERGLVEDKKGLSYHAINSGKLRRYFDIQNFIDPFRVIHGIFQSISIIRKLKPKVIFSKGGFVTVPVVIAGFLNRVPVIIHESDITPGLANKLSFPFAKRICTTFPETLDYFKGNKAIHTGTPLRDDLLEGDFDKGLKITGFMDKKPHLLVMGGSLGAVAVNNLLRSILNELLEDFNVIHLCGKGNFDKSLKDKDGYRQFEYVNEEMPHLLKMADIVLSRAGANSIYELLALRKPNLLIPLPLGASRGDQILNAASFKKQGFSMVLDQNETSEEELLKTLYELYDNRQSFIDNMSEKDYTEGINNILKVIDEERKS